MSTLVNPKDFPHPLKFLHYIHPVLGAVCIDEFCEHNENKQADPHAHPREQQTYG